MSVRTLLLTLLYFFSFGAQAVIITIDPDNYAHGTDLSHVGPGLTLNVLRQSSYDIPESSVYAPLVTPLLAVDCDQSRCGAHEGTREFGHQLTDGLISHAYGEINIFDWCYDQGLPSSCRDGFSVLEMVFDQPTDFLQLETVWGSDPAAIMAFNSAGERLFYCGANYTSCTDMIHTEIVNGDYNSTFVVERSQRDISRVIFGAIMGSAHLGEISYRVPEPGTLALFAMTLGLAGFARRRTHLNR
jgi:hypothetical protein